MSTPAPGRIRVLLADDHPIFRSGLRAVVAAMDDAEVVGEASNGVEVLEMTSALEPSVVVMDLHMPDLDGVEATRRLSIEQPRCGVLVLTMSHEDEWVRAALRAGALGYLVKGAERSEIETAIRSVHRGDAVLAARIARRALAFVGPTESTSPFPQLTPRELEVLAHLAKGRTNPEVARLLSLSPKTVRNLVSSVIFKLDATDRGGAIRRAQSAGLG